MISFCLGSDWFRGWREFSGPITDLGKAQANNSGLLPTLDWKLLCTRFFFKLKYMVLFDIQIVYWCSIAREYALVGTAIAYRLSLQSVHFLIGLKNKRLRQSTNWINTAAWVGFLFLVSIEFSAFLVFLPLGIGFQILLTDFNFLRRHYFPLYSNFFSWFFIPVIIFFFRITCEQRKLSIAEITPTLLITSFRRLTVR